MNGSSLAPPLARVRPTRVAAQADFRLTAALAGFAGVACLLAGSLPIGVSIVTVFLFAAPHNLFEARYMLARLPGRFGPLAGYFATGAAGVLLLVAGFALLPWLASWKDWGRDEWLLGAATWNTALALWIMLLCELRSRQRPVRDLRWVHPLGFLAIAGTWLWPQAWDLALVYLHPLVALWFLDRELGRNRAAWRGAYRRALALLPLLLAVLWLQLWDSPSLAGLDALTVRITNHAGADVLDNVSSHLLVATHVFLETLHYGVWLVAIPLVSFRTPPWDVAQVPLARRSLGWRRGLLIVLACTALVVVLFWAGFLADYPLTRDVYFTLAMVHVLAELPMLLRLL